MKHIDAHYFSAAYLRFLFFTTSGRLNRERYITAHFFLLACFLAYFILTAVIAITLGHLWYSAATTFKIFWLSILCGAVLCFLLTLPVKIKRAHDMGISGHLCWLWLVPGVSFFPALWLMFKRGSKDSNQHG